MKQVKLELFRTRETPTPEIEKRINTFIRSFSHEIHSVDVRPYGRPGDAYPAMLLTLVYEVEDEKSRTIKNDREMPKTQRKTGNKKSK